jgi:membrane protease YdiL (CAAX protease family)
MGIVAVTLGPFVEELLFRGIALPLLARYTSTHWAVFLVSATFAVLHFHVPSFVPLFVIALAFSYAYLYTGSILVPVIMHALFNGVSLVNALLMGNSSAGLLF